MTIMVLAVAVAMAQAPEKFTYQAVVRNASNVLVTNAPVGVRVSILQGSASGNAVYVETHTASTNANGLLTIEIGGGTAQQGSFVGINWADGPFYLKTETDPAGGSNYTVTSTQQLMSVPYALYAKEAGNGFSGDYNDLTNKPTIPQSIGDLTNNAGYVTEDDLPTVPTNVSAFINDAGYITMDSIPAQVNADWNATEGAAEILNKPANANFGHGVVLTKVNNAEGATDITVGFTNYTLMTGGVVSLSFTNDVPAGATLNINNQGAKPIHYRGSALTAGVIKANDRCLFMYNATAGRYFLLANDRWGVDVDALATVAHTGSYNDLTDKPTLATVATTGNYNDLTDKPELFSGNYNDLTGTPELFSGNYNDLTGRPEINNGTLTIQQNGSNLGTFTANQSANQTVDITTPTLADMQALINSSLAPLQNQVDNLQGQVDTLQDQKNGLQEELDNMNFVCGVSTVKDYDGNEYNTVKIGNQCWTKENLRTMHYSDGTEIPYGGNTVSTTTGYRYNYITSTIPFKQRGFLYNWAAVMHGEASSDANPSGVQGICPTGWHVPSDAEWTQLADYVGSQSQYLCDGSDNTSIAKALASSEWWNSSSTDCAVGNNSEGNNATGFAALPAGFHLSDGYVNNRYYADFWSATEASTGYAWELELGYGNAVVYGGSTYEGFGLSVRCLRDNLSVSDQLNSANEQIAAQQEELDNLSRAYDCEHSIVMDYDGNVYNTVMIGDQCWMRENLRTTHYSDGTLIPDGGSTTSTTTGYRYDYATSTIPFAQRGYLYNWAAVMNGTSSSDANPSGVQGICPTGWHVPSDTEWTQLTDYVSSRSQYLCDASDNTSIGKALAAPAWWNSSSADCAVGNNPGGNNASGFGAVPAGYRSGSLFYVAGDLAYFWSATQRASYPDYAFYRYLNYLYAGVYRGYYYKDDGYSVRCLRD